MRLTALILSLTLPLAACGVDGAPHRPAPKAAAKAETKSLTLEGQVKAGIVSP